MDDCLFCKIAAGEIPANVVYEDELVMFFRDIAPQAPVHIIGIPKRHVASLDCLTVEDTLGAAAILGKIKDIAAAEGLSENGYRVVINTGRDGGQTVPHLHFHILGGRGLAWPPG